MMLSVVIPAHIEASSIGETVTAPAGALERRRPGPPAAMAGEPLRRQRR